MLLRLLARLRVDHDLAYADPAVVTGVGVRVLGVLGGVAWKGSPAGDIVCSSIGPDSFGPCLREIRPSAGASYVVNGLMMPWV